MRRLAFALLLAGPALAADPYRGPIIDVHLHSFRPTTDTTTVPNPVTGQLPAIPQGSNHMKATLAAMREYNVVLGIVSAGEGGMESAAWWHEADPPRIVAAAGFDGTSEAPIPDVGELRKAIAAQAYWVIGEISPQYAGLSISDPRFEPVLALAEELDLPVAVHTGVGEPGISYKPCCRGFRTALGNPQTVEDALNRHPKLRIYLTHGGWPWTQETVALMTVYPQLHADLAMIDWLIPREEFHSHLRALVRAGLASRLMFGTDQMRWPQAIGMAVEGVNSAPFLTAQQKSDIFCGNAARFLRLEGSANPCKAPLGK